MQDFSDPPGWLGLLLCGTAAAWYLYQTRAGSLLHVLGGVTLGAGVLLACTASGSNVGRNSDWMEYHLLFSGWAAAALVVSGAAFACRSIFPVAQN